MSDNQPTAEAVADPAAASKIDESAEVKPTATEEATNGSAEVAAIEESNTNKDEDKAANGDSEKKTGGAKDGPKYDRGDRRNGGGRFDRQRRPRNTEFDNLPETDDPVEIRAQVEFYFSSQNLSTDKHLFFELDGPKNRPVPIQHLSTFKRMQRFKPYSAIVSALRESEDLEVVDERGPGNEGVKRKVPLSVPKKDYDDKHPPDTEELYRRMLRTSINKLENSVYVKGFAEEGQEVGQIALEQFFKPYGAVMIRKRRDDDNSWKGSVFVEFDSEESQQQFLALDPKPKFNDQDLTIMSKKDYSEMKCKEKGITPAWQKDTEYTSARRDRRDREHRGGRDGRSGRDGRRSRGGQGGRGRHNGRGRYNDRSRRDRSLSRSSEDSRDWNNRRDRFQKSKDFDRKSDNSSKPIERDNRGVPVVKDAHQEAESKKRKGDEADRDDVPKKSKIEVKEDE